MDMIENEDREKILLATLPHVPFDGWAERALRMGAEDAGFSAITTMRAFPGGADEMIRFWGDYSDRQMLSQMGEVGPAKLEFRDRMETAIRLRIAVNEPYREAVRRTLSYLSLPQHSAMAARITIKTVSALWYAVGDSSTDFSYYTKRATLVPIYVAAVLYWLDDTSEDNAATWSFVARQIDNALILPRMQGRLRGALETLAAPFAMRPRWSRSATLRSRTESQSFS